jgi:hypothetical protein
MGIFKTLFAIFAIASVGARATGTGSTKPFQSSYPDIPSYSIYPSAPIPAPHGYAPIRALSPASAPTPAPAPIASLFPSTPVRPEPAYVNDQIVAPGASVPDSGSSSVRNSFAAFFAAIFGAFFLA